MELIGLLPAAGRGARLGSIPCSKEIMPLGFRTQLNSIADKKWQPVTTIETHLEAYKIAGINNIAIIISSGKYDIVKYLGNGEQIGISIAYFFQEEQKGMPYALDIPYAWLQDRVVLFSMPDTLITPPDFMTNAVEHHHKCGADVTLGLFITDTPEKFGMVELDSMGKIKGFVDKPKNSDLELMWGFSVWSWEFSKFIHEYLAKTAYNITECVLSDVFFAALKDGLKFEPYISQHARYHDIGTPESFQSAVYELALNNRLDDL